MINRKFLGTRSYFCHIPRSHLFKTYTGICIYTYIYIPQSIFVAPYAIAQLSTVIILGVQNFESFCVNRQGNYSRASICDKKIIVPKSQPLMIEHINFTKQFG